MRKRYIVVNFLLGVSIAGFGIAQLITQHFLQGLLPFDEMPVQSVWINLIGSLFLVMGILFMLRKWLRYAVLGASLLFALFALYPHAIKLMADPYNGSKWTGLFECVALSGGLLFVGFIQHLYKGLLPAWVGVAARWTFALSLLIFGIQHFMYASFIATLIPGWLPWHLFWAYFVGVAFIAAAVSFFSGMMIKLASTGLAIMFFSWVLILHAPRVVTNYTIEPEWTSLFVALAMGAIALAASDKMAVSSSAKVSGVKDEELTILS